MTELQQHRTKFGGSSAAPWHHERRAQDCLLRTPDFPYENWRLAPASALDA
ncbi:hypothetical protein OU995_25010 [Roseateles sp. SL47]|uniref:hypothetical protein n=1 Tax=Roseateles sp. SL47 TaxID=2995138 RepID=UPI00226EB990|nr:hypothetical protein [Roseateles sp. SL47]WAC72752.1 hypothetical protein OU995_25010 [Roseateles sp. SL47]